MIIMVGGDTSSERFLQMFVFGRLPLVTNSGGHRSRSVQLQTMVTNGFIPNQSPLTQERMQHSVWVSLGKERASIDASPLAHTGVYR